MFFLLGAETRLAGALLLAAGATSYRAGRVLRVALAVESASPEALVVARAWSTPSPYAGLVRAGFVVVPVLTLAAVAVTLAVGRGRLAPYVLGLGALSMIDLAIGRWVDRRCLERLRDRIA